MAPVVAAAVLAGVVVAGVMLRARWWRAVCLRAVPGAWRAVCLRAWCLRRGAWCVVPAAWCLRRGAWRGVAPGWTGACGPGGAAAVVRAGMPLLAGVGGQERRRGAPGRCGAPGPGGQGRRVARHHLGAACAVRGGRRPWPARRRWPRRPPQAAEDGQHPARVPGVGPGDRDARIRERGMHLLILGIAGHRRADLRQGPDRRADVHRPARRGPRCPLTPVPAADADRGGAADQVRGALLVGSRAAQVHRVPVVADAPAGVAVQPVDRPARRDPDRVPGVTDHLERRAAGLRREPHRGSRAPGIGWAGANTPSPAYVSATTNAKVITRRICIPPNAIAPATAGGRRQASRLPVPCAFSRQAHRPSGRRR